MDNKKVLATFNLTCYEGHNYDLKGTGDSASLMFSLIKLANDDQLMKEVILGAAWEIAESELNKPKNEA